MEWAGKHQFPGFEVALFHKYHFIPKQAFLKRYLDFAARWVYVSTRYMKVSHNEWGALTWLLIHSNEKCSHRAYARNK